MHVSGAHGERTRARLARVGFSTPTRALSRSLARHRRGRAIFPAARRTGLTPAQAEAEAHTPRGRSSSTGRAAWLGRRRPRRPTAATAATGGKKWPTSQPRRRRRRRLGRGRARARARCPWSPATTTRPRPQQQPPPRRTTTTASTTTMATATGTTRRTGTRRPRGRVWLRPGRTPMRAGAWPSCNTASACRTRLPRPPQPRPRRQRLPPPTRDNKLHPTTNRRQALTSRGPRSAWARPTLPRS